MKHNIIVKWNEKVGNKTEMLQKVRKQFASCAELAGVHGVQVIPNCIDRANRYDVMIAIDMERNALEKWDESEIHKTWKRDFGDFIAQKAIFDFE